MRSHRGPVGIPVLQGREDVNEYLKELSRFAIIASGHSIHGTRIDRRGIRSWLASNEGLDHACRQIQKEVGVTVVTAIRQLGHLSENDHRIVDRAIELWRNVDIHEVMEIAARDLDMGNAFENWFVESDVLEDANWSGAAKGMLLSWNAGIAVLKVSTSRGIPSSTAHTTRP